MYGGYCEVNKTILQSSSCVQLSVFNASSESDSNDSGSDIFSKKNFCMKPSLRIDVQLANSYAQGVHPTLCKIRKKKARHSPLSNSVSIDQLTFTLGAKRVFDVVETDETGSKGK